MRFRIALEDEARAQLRDLVPEPKREVRRTLREMEGDPYALDAIPLRPPLEGLHRVRVGDYRIVFEPGRESREVTVARIGHRDWVYEGLKRPSEDD